MVVKVEAKSGGEAPAGAAEKAAVVAPSAGAGGKAAGAELAELRTGPAREELVETDFEV